MKLQCQTSINIRHLNKLAIELFQDNENQQIVYNDKFILSKQTSISLLRSTSKICFSLIKQYMLVSSTKNKMILFIFNVYHRFHLRISNNSHVNYSIQMKIIISFTMNNVFFLNKILILLYKKKIQLN
jgi:hypothetical protein